MARALDLGVDDVHDCLVHTFGLADGEVRGDEYVILCPNPAHDDRDPSCGVNLTTGYWNCFACAIGGDLADLGKWVLGIPQRKVKELLLPSTPEAVLTLVQRKIAGISRPDKARAKARTVTLPGPYDDGPLTELRQRGFTRRTLRRWGVRHCTVQTLVGNSGDEFTIRNSIAIPIRDERGRLLAWCYRATKASPQWQQRDARYLYTPEFPINEVWFGLQHHNPSTTRTITVVEGSTDTMWLDQCAIPAWGLLGSQMGRLKLRRLFDFDEVILFADRDNAGAKWVQRIGTEIGRVVPTKVVIYDKRIARTYVDLDEPNRRKRKIDPEMLVPIDVELLWSRAIPWAQFARRLAASG